MLGVEDGGMGVRVAGLQLLEAALELRDAAAVEVLEVSDGQPLALHLHE